MSSGTGTVARVFNGGRTLNDVDISGGEIWIDGVEPNSYRDKNARGIVLFSFRPAKGFNVGDRVSFDFVEGETPGTIHHVTNVQAI